jgi:hypothetical protein
MNTSLSKWQLNLLQHRFNIKKAYLNVEPQTRNMKRRMTPKLHPQPLKYLKGGIDELSTLSIYI